MTVASAGEPLIASMIRRRLVVAMAAAAVLGTLALVAPDEEMRLRVVTEQSPPKMD